MTLSHESIDRGNPRYPFAPVLRADLLTRIYELNSDYLELLATERTADECMGQLPYFAPRLKASFADLSLEHRARLAAAPYALYSLRFEDVRFWQTASRTPRQPIEERYAVAPSSGSLRTLFVEIALLQAWHIANTHPLAARVLYSMGSGPRACCDHAVVAGEAHRGGTREDHDASLADESLLLAGSRRVCENRRFGPTRGDSVVGHAVDCRGACGREDEITEESTTESTEMSHDFRTVLIPSLRSPRALR